MAASKNVDHNSYKSPDRINQIDWNRESEFLDVFKYYQELIKLRKQHPAFRMKSAYDIRNHLFFSGEYQPGVASYILANHANGDSWRNILVIFNGNPNPISFRLNPENKWRIVAQNHTINPESSEFVAETELQVPGI